jgi:hypothetical protein
LVTSTTASSPESAASSADWVALAMAESLTGDRTDLLACVTSRLTSRWPDLGDRYLDGSWPDDAARQEMVVMVADCDRARPGGPLVSDSLVRAIVTAALERDGGRTDDVTVDCVISGLRRETPGLLEGLRDPDSLTAEEHLRALAVFDGCERSTP